MKLICSQSELNSALQLVSRAVAVRPTHPVLANVLLTADAGTNRLSLTGFDLSLGIQTTLNATVETSGAITLPARLLGEIVSKLSNADPISLISEDSGQEVEIKSNSSSYKVRGLFADDFPELPLVENGTSLKINPKSLINALRSTIFASSTDEAKQLLTGVYLNFQETSFEAAATDGHRLAVLNLKNALVENLNLKEDEENLSVTLPSRSLKELERFITMSNDDQPINLFTDSGQVVFMSSNQVITSRTLDGIYPNYSQLIPDGFSKILTFNRKNFISALERIAVIADQHNNVVKIETDNTNKLLKISVDAQDVGSGFESLPLNFDGDSIQIAFNVKYLLEGLRVINSEDVTLKCNASTTPAIFSPSESKDDFIYLVMPVQIRS